jgi:hypothetical protein
VPSEGSGDDDRGDEAAAYSLASEIRQALLCTEEVSDAQSAEMCRRICHQRAVLEHGLLSGTVRVGFASGMSGHFIARIRKTADSIVSVVEHP